MGSDTLVESVTRSIMETYQYFGFLHGDQDDGQDKLFRWKSLGSIHYLLEVKSGIMVEEERFRARTA
jgi:hypothetical protein